MSGSFNPISPVSWQSLLRQQPIPFRDATPSSPTYTKAEMLAPPLSLQPLDNLINANQKERYRMLLGQPQHRAKFHLGGIWDERTHEGRAALLDVLIPEVVP